MSDMRNIIPTRKNKDKIIHFNIPNPEYWEGSNISIPPILIGVIAIKNIKKALKNNHEFIHTNVTSIGVRLIRLEFLLADLKVKQYVQENFPEFLI